MNLEEARIEISNASTRESDNGYCNGFLTMRDRALKILREVDDCPAKVVIPQFVANLMSHYSSAIEMLGNVYFDTSSDNEIENDNLVCWIEENEETFFRAWIDGYEIEEPLYYVKLPTYQWDKEEEALAPHFYYLGFDITSDETALFQHTHSRIPGYKFTLTEQEIKDIDERFWAFAIPVATEGHHA